MHQIGSDGRNGASSPGGKGQQTDRFTFSQSLGIVVGSLALLIAGAAVFAPPLSSGNTTLTRDEALIRDSLIAQFHMSKREATRITIANRLSPEAARRLEYERRQRKADTEKLLKEACASNPWAERCQ